MFAKLYRAVHVQLATTASRKQTTVKRQPQIRPPLQFGLRVPTLRRLIALAVPERVLVLKEIHKSLAALDACAQAREPLVPKECKAAHQQATAAAHERA